MALFSAFALLAALIACFVAARYAALAVFRGIAALRAGALTRTVRRGRARFVELLARTPAHRVYKRAVDRKRQDAMRAALPDMLRLLCMALDSGSSLVKGIEYAANNCVEPLATELKRTVWDLEAGQGFDEAMEKLRARTGSDEFAYLAVAMEIQHRCGGSLSVVLADAAASLHKVAELEDALAAGTAQGRLSARIVALLPFVLLAVLSLFSPGYLASFFTSVLGVFMFALALVLEALGVVGVRRVLAVDVARGGLEVGA